MTDWISPRTRLPTPEDEGPLGVVLVSIDTVHGTELALAERNPGSTTWTAYRREGGRLRQSGLDQRWIIAWARVPAAIDWDRSRKS